MALEVNQSLRQIIPDYDAIESLERRITPEEERKIDSRWLAVTRKWLGQQGFSYLFSPGSAVQAHASDFVKCLATILSEMNAATVAVGAP